MTPALGTLAVIALILFAIFCAYMNRRSRRPKDISDYEIALTGDRRTADVLIFPSAHDRRFIR